MTTSLNGESPETTPKMPTAISPIRFHLCTAIGILTVIPILILTGALPFEWRMNVLVFVGLGFILWSRLLGLSLAELGIRRDTLRQGILLQAPLSAFFLAVVALAPLLGLGNRYVPPNPEFFLFYVLISSPCQEFVYRSFLLALARRIQLRPLMEVLLLIIPYAWVHIIYRDAITLAFTLIIGLAWSITYRRAPNLLAVSLSHALLGVVTIVLGLI